MSTLSEAINAYADTGFTEHFAGGTLTDAFGVYSNPVISEFKNGVAIERVADARRGTGRAKELRMK